MSRTTKVVIGAVVGFLFLLIVGFSALFMFLNREKEPISADEFCEIMEDEDFEMVDSVDQYDMIFGEDVVDESYIALGEDYQIEFLSFSDLDDAKIIYDQQCEIFDSLKGNGSKSASTSTSMKNYERYSLTTDGEYKFVARIDDTMVYADVDEDYKDEVKEFMEEFGY